MLSMTEAMAREEVKASEAAYEKSAEPFKYSKSPAALQESERRWETELATARAQQKTEEAGPCAILPYAVEIAKPHKGQVEVRDRGQAGRATKVVQEPCCPTGPGAEMEDRAGHSESPAEDAGGRASCHPALRCGDS